MIVAYETNYDKLLTESSNLLIESDSRQAAGQYEEAAVVARQAGELRVRMGHLRNDIKDFEAAAEDWLSAAACFVRGGSETQAESAVDLVKHLKDRSRIPADRIDLLSELDQRELEIQQLKSKRTDFLHQFGSRHQLDTADTDTLKFLLDWRFSLPGYSLLHYAVFRQAQLLDKLELAGEHLTYAWMLDNTNEHYVALLGYMFAKLGRFDRAKDLGERFLDASEQETGAVRIMLANIFGTEAEGWKADLEAAIEVLSPVAVQSSYSISNRLAAIALSAGFCRELGRPDDASKFLDLLMASGADQAAIMDFLPLVGRNSTNGNSSGAVSITDSPCKLLIEKAKRISLPLAA